MHEGSEFRKKHRIRGQMAVEAFPVKELDVTIRPVPASFSFSCVNFNGLNHDDYAQAEGVFEVETVKSGKGTYDLRDFLDGRLIRRGFQTENDAELWLTLHHMGRDLLDTSWRKGILIKIEHAIDQVLATRLEIPTYGDAMIFPSLGVNARAKIVAYQVLSTGRSAQTMQPSREPVMAETQCGLVFPTGCGSRYTKP